MVCTTVINLLSQNNELTETQVLCFQNCTTCFALKTENNGTNYTFPTLFPAFHSLSLHSCCLEVRFDRHFCFTCTWALLYLGNANLQPKLWYENKARTTQLLSTATSVYHSCQKSPEGLSSRVDPPQTERRKAFLLRIFFFLKRESLYECVFCYCCCCWFVFLCSHGYPGTHLVD